jgi:L-asparaginase
MSISPPTSNRGGWVSVLGLGGTIAMTPGSGDGVRPTLSAAELVSAVPGLADIGVSLDVEDVCQAPGASLTFEDIHAVSALISGKFSNGAEGIVVTQGTDTIEESAFLLDLVHRGRQPVVVTGAMRSPSVAGADGPANLLAAVQVAASPSSRGLGVVVVLADEIHAASRVRKAHSTSGTTFQSPNGGPLGYVVEGHPRVLNRLPAREPLPVANPAAAPDVALMTISFGDTGRLLDGMIDRLDGLVIAGFGVGHVPRNLVATLEAFARRMPVVLASRTGAGPVLARTYALEGSEVDLLGRGLISAEYLDPLKARLLLRHLIAAGCNRGQINGIFSTQYRDRVAEEVHLGPGKESAFA